MGWTFYHRTPKAETNTEHFDAMLRPNGQIVASGTVDGVFYAAVHDTTSDEVFAFIALTQWTRGDFNFGYKNMDETMGPVRAKPPKKVLAALTPPSNDRAREWRDRAAEYHAQREFLTSRLRHGDTVRLTRPLRFTNGTTVGAFTFTRPRRGDQGYLTVDHVRYNLPNWRDRVVVVVTDEGECLTPLGRRQMKQDPDVAAPGD